MCEEQEQQENELQEQREREERELEDMIRAEQVCLEEEKRQAEEEEQHLDEAHREWLRRLEEVKQAPEEEEEAEPEPSAPKKEKSWRSGKLIQQIFNKTNGIFYRRWYLPAANASREGMIFTRKHMDPGA